MGWKSQTLTNTAPTLPVRASWKVPTEPSKSNRGAATVSQELAPVFTAAHSPTSSMSVAYTPPMYVPSSKSQPVNSMALEPSVPKVTLFDATVPAMGNTSSPESNR